MDNLFLQACRGEATPRTPIWLNRQAGRYMAEYHEVKGNLSSLEFFKNPDRAAQATLDAQRILGVDAAIMFADLLPILEPMGLALDYIPGVGPVFENPVRSERDVASLVTAPAQEATPYIHETVTNIRSGLPDGVGLIGFAGAPFTLASYAVEGRGSRNYVWVKKMMYETPALWQRLSEKLTDQLISYLQLQIDAGVDAVQLFDSWVGCLSVADFRRYVVPETRRLIEALSGQVPIIYFGTGNGHLLGDVAALGPDVVALDWRVPLADSWRQMGCTAVQGNLDPIVLCADRATIAREAQRVLDEAAGRPGHIFNLGHGIIPETPVDSVKFLVEYVQEHSVV
ncbi:MAG: uroporphyrinogen decarboxylase [Pseudomonadales bacterium]|nr:uroporphyrinogen decarboxylase [Pseudomonadales bacterium]MDP6469510.1 uroporphyrinogen decarboxylase [Pseudomonadales bacterium]MDP6827352.1 uroporphyrinogen decarboxylase [Pseudomonadales bacterium]MDP6971174.1 uroporphyrinogen decarboxylase [Pseudomonadales bacterium]